MSYKQLCRACLATDVKMFSINKPPLKEAYQHIIPTICFGDQVQWVCYQCAHMLQKYHKFYLKCHQANEIYMSLGMDSNSTIIDKLKDIDRNQLNLTSTLSKTLVFFNTIVQINSDEDDMYDKTLDEYKYDIEENIATNNEVIVKELMDHSYTSTTAKEDSDFRTNRKKLTVTGQTYFKKHFDIFKRKNNEELIETVETDTISDVEVPIETSIDVETITDTGVTNFKKVFDNLKTKKNEELIKTVETDTMSDVEVPIEMLDSDTSIDNETFTDTVLTNFKVFDNLKTKKTEELIKSVESDIMSDVDAPLEMLDSDTSTDNETFTDTGLTNFQLVDNLKTKKPEESIKTIETDTMSDVDVLSDMLDSDTSIDEENSPNTVRENIKKLLNSLKTKKNKGVTKTVETDANSGEYTKMLDSEKSMDKNKIANTVGTDFKNTKKIEDLIKTLKAGVEAKPFANRAKRKRKRAGGDETIDRRLTVNEKDFEGFAKVVILSPEEARKEVLLRKESFNYRNCDFKCDLCYRAFQYENTFKNHMKKHKEENGPYQCPSCFLRFPRQPLLTRHHLTTHKRKFYCEKCPYTGFCSTRALTHMKLHKGKIYECEECYERFSMPNTLATHKRKKHRTGNEVVCPQCGSIFSSEWGFLAHKTKIHRLEKNEPLGPTCKECGVHFTSETAWKRHLVLSNRHTVLNGCDICGESFPDEASYKSHHKKHKPAAWINKPYANLPCTCEICDEWISSRSEYKSHMLNEHANSNQAKRIAALNIYNKKCVCDICGKLIKRTSLAVHRQRHTTETSFKCKECDKQYKTSGSLYSHVVAHHKKKQKIFKCQICGKILKSTGALAKHTKGHLGIKPFKCLICEKDFINIYNLKDHINVHNKEPRPKCNRSKRKRKAVQQS